MAPRFAIGCLVVLALAARTPAQTFDPTLRTGPSRPALVLTSPGGAVTVWVGVDATGRLWYSAVRQAAVALDASPLGIIVDGVDLGARVVDVFATRAVTTDDTYTMHGNHRIARNRYNETMVAAYREGPGDPLFLFVVRVYDDGVAYRYFVPGGGPRAISGEASAWRLPAGSVVWAQSNTDNYESPYSALPLGAVDWDIGGPMTIALPQRGGYVVITEGALRNYSGMTYHVDVGSTVVRSAFLDDVSWIVPAGSPTPWRLAILSATLDGLVNCDLVANVNDPPDPRLFPHGADTWFVRGGRAVWSWWTNHDSTLSYDVQLQYVRYASMLRAEYVLIDAGWELGFPTATQDQFARLADFVESARLAGSVRVWVWKEFTELADEQTRRYFFRRVRDAGAVGVKIDKVYGTNAESMANVQLQEAMLHDAAEFRLMVNLHGVEKATGLQRTYPNAITHEGAMGIEPSGFWLLNIFVPPGHATVLPFVRMVAGPTDYTPMTLDPRKLGDTTFGHQLATAGLITSPVVHFADDPALIIGQPAIHDIVRMLPTDWDETIVLPWSGIGQAAAFARRSGRRWWVFAVSGDATSGHTVEMPLTFLDDRAYDAVVVSDESRTSFRRVQRGGVGRYDAIAVDVLAGGGFVAVFSPSPDRSTHVQQGFTSLASEDSQLGWVRAYATILQHGDLVAHSLQVGVPWNEALQSSDPATFPAGLRARWDVMRRAANDVVPGHARYLMVNPIDTSNYAALAPYWAEHPEMPLPAPWNTYAFDHPDVKRAYLNYLIAAVEFFQPTYLATSIEANILLSHAPQKWTAFKALHAYVYDELKRRYPSLRVFPTIHYEHLRGFSAESGAYAAGVAEIDPDVLLHESADLLRHGDLLALSTYPYMIAGNRYISEIGLDADYYDVADALAQATGRQIAIDQTGYLSQDVYLGYINYTLHGSDYLQSQFLDLVLRDAHTYGFAFVVNFVAWDYGLNYGNDPTPLTWAYSGLVREDGTPKPALAVWESYR
jgi:alpha-glucosidase